MKVQILVKRHHNQYMPEIKVEYMRGHTNNDKSYWINHT